MKVITETRYCDGCGVGPQKGSTNVPYLGWLFIEARPQGIPGADARTADLCPACAHRVWTSIPQ